MTQSLVLCRNVKIPVEFRTKEYHDEKAVELVRQLYNKKLKSKLGDASFFIYKKSVDARRTDSIVFIYTVGIILKNHFDAKVISSKLTKEFELVEAAEPVFEMAAFGIGKSEKPVIAGFGPAGMFCAYALASAGLKPVVIERGADVDKRARLVDKYWQTGELDESSNVQFGEGGAGTFSDGKLLTRIGDPLTSYVMKTLHKHGAPKEITYISKPHVGTDLLRGIVKSMREEIVSLGGTVLFESALTGIKRDLAGRVTSVSVNNSFDLECTALFLCIGHSARDTFGMLTDNDFHVSPKPFSVGIRVEHLQKDITASLYGSFAECEALEKAQYTLSAKNNDRGVYSFCMCPGGTVVASASEKDEIVTNGMSNFKRDGLNANSAIAVSVDTKDYGNTVSGSIDFQKKIEQAAFKLAGGNGAAPIQLLGDYLSENGNLGEPSRVLPTYTGKTAVCDISKIFPKFINDSLKTGFSVFERQIMGFSVSDAVITAPETRTSSPVRINRGEDRTSLSCGNVYPCGEGAGYAGGITSAAVDGLKSAVAYLESFRGR